MTPRDPEEVTAGRALPAAELPAATRMGAVHLTVADLDRSLKYYERTLGLRPRRRDGATATLSADGGEDLLVLREEPGARPARGHSGLYHFALLLPQRRDLAGWLAHVARERLPLEGLSDHFVSEAVYLRDPDEHGIEVYWDRPRSHWDGLVRERLTTQPLDTGSLFGELDDPASESFHGLPTGTTMGHVHFCVADAAEAAAFYRDVLGFGLMAALGRQAVFLSAGGYHHHVGANSWESAGALQAPPGTARLERATVLLPSPEDRDAVARRLEAVGADFVRSDAGALLVRDPSGNPLAFDVLAGAD